MFSISDSDMWCSFQKNTPRYLKFWKNISHKLASHSAIRETFWLFILFVTIILLFFPKLHKGYIKMVTDLTYVSSVNSLLTVVLILEKSKKLRKVLVLKNHKRNWTKLIINIQEFIGVVVHFKVTIINNNSTKKNLFFTI